MRDKESFICNLNKKDRFLGMRLCRRSDLLFNSYNNLGTTDLKERLDRAPVVFKEKEAKKFQRRPSYWAQKTCESQHS